MINGLLLALVLGKNTTNEDIRYYFHGVNPDAPHQAGPDSIYKMSGPIPLGEYPDAGVWPLRLLDVLAGGNEERFLALFSVMCVLISGLFLGFLLRWGSRYQDRVPGGKFHSAWFWVLFSAAAGPILLTRLDLISGVSVGLGLALALSHPGVASFILAYATVSKLWPGVLAAALVGKATLRSTWVRLCAFFASLFALAAVTVLVWEPGRLVSPISYQDVRGLQIESVFATPLMVARLFDAHKWHVDYASSKSFEIFGPGVETATLVANILLLGLLIFALGFALWRFLHGGWTQQSAVLFALLLVCLLIVSNKVFSPQYIAWVAPLVALASIMARFQTMRLLRWSVVIAAGLTTLVYPVAYESILHNTSAWPIVILVVRNIGMVLITVLTAKALLESIKQPRPTHSGTGYRVAKRAFPGRVSSTPIKPRQHTVAGTIHARRKSSH